MKVFTAHLDHNLIVKMIKIRIKKTTAKEDEIDDANDDIDKYKLAFIGSNREKFNFNTFRVPISFL